MANKQLEARIGKWRPKLQIVSDPGNVVVGDFQAHGDIPVLRVLSGALAASISEIVILGYDQDGEEYFASSEADCRKVLWLLERMKQQLLRDAK